MEHAELPPRQPMSVTAVMSIAAVAAALIAILGRLDDITAVTVVFALIGLVPWALEAGGVRLPPALFLVATMVPAIVIVIVDRNEGGIFPILLAVVWLTWSTTSVAIRTAAVTIAAAVIVGLALVERSLHETGMVYFLGGLGLAWIAGLMVRRQETLVSEIRVGQAKEAHYAAAAERTRIAREVHDVVAHSLTVTMLHVTGARRAIDHDPAGASQALERAESVGRESLDSIRQVVGLLRSSDATDEAPMPAIDDIPALITRFREAGLVVDANLRIDDVDTDPATSLTSFRIVQEALSNVLQHAPGAPVELSIAGDRCGRTLHITAENPTSDGVRSDGRVGMGLRGMSERIRVVGGSLEVGVTDHSTWRIEAHVPLRSVAASR